MNASDVYAWLMQHDWQMLLVLTYVLVNVGPRPNPENLKGYKRVIWLLIDRLAWLSAEKVPGDWKWIFTASPLPPRSGSPPAAASPAAAPPPNATPAADAPVVHALPPEPPPK